MPVMIDPKHTRVVLQVSVSAQTELASSEVETLLSRMANGQDISQQHTVQPYLFKKGQMSETAHEQSIVHVASLCWR